MEQVSILLSTQFNKHSLSICETWQTWERMDIPQKIYLRGGEGVGEEIQWYSQKSKGFLELDLDSDLYNLEQVT